MHKKNSFAPRWRVSSSIRESQAIPFAWIQLELFPQQQKRKPQISSVPGISPKERNRYRVTLGNQVLGDRLTLDEALKLAKGGER
jgi:hypothetical protein